MNTLFKKPSNYSNIISEVKLLKLDFYSYKNQTDQAKIGNLNTQIREF